MSLRRKWLFAMLAGLLIFGVIPFFFSDRQPSYQGKPLAYWLTLKSNQLKRVGFQADDEFLANERRSEEAILQMGTNCLPYLLRWVAYEPPAWKTRLISRLAGVRWIPERFREDRSDRLAAGAQKALEVLGPSASSAIPQLARLAWDSSRVKSADRAASCLLFVGAEAQPVITDLLSHRTSYIRYGAAYQIARLGANSLPAVPQLIDCLKDPDKNVAARAARVLGDLKLRPELSVPALTNALTDGRVEVAVEAEIALQKFEVAFPDVSVPQKFPDRSGTNSAFRGFTPRLPTNPAPVRGQPP